MTLVLTRATKQAARYTDAGGRERCSGCRFFMPQGTCGRIVGPVSPRGWCKYFSQEAVQRWQPGVVPAQGGPSLALDFISTPGVMPASVVFTRASTATYFDSSGTMQTASGNTPRWDYDPVTHGLRGLLIEEARTNVLLNTATLGTQSVAVTAQAYTLSFYGTGTVTMSGAFAGSLVGTGAFPARVQTTFTPAAGTLTCTVTGSVLNAQLEAGAFPTSYIPTAAAAVTRAQDTCQLPVAAWFNPTTYSMQMEFIVPAVNATYGGISDAAFGANTSYFNNSAWISQGLSVGGAPLNAGVVSKTCGRVATTGVAISNNGGAVAGNVGALPGQGGATRLAIGNDPWSLGSAFNGWMRRVRVWPRVLSDVEMQSVTT